MFKKYVFHILNHVTEIHILDLGTFNTRLLVNITVTLLRQIQLHKPVRSEFDGLDLHFLFSLGLENEFEAGLKSIPLWVFSSRRIPVAHSRNKRCRGSSLLFILLVLIKAPSTLFLHTRVCLLSGGSKQWEFLPDRWLNSSWIDLVCMDVHHVQMFKACAWQWSWLPKLP